MPPHEQTNLLTVAQTAERLTISGQGVRHLIRRGDIEAIRVGHSIRIRREVVSDIEQNGTSRKESQ